MPTCISHAAVAIAGGVGLGVPLKNWRFWVASLLCTAGPDLDVGMFFYNVEYTSMFGHRGIMHSLPFALVAGVYAAAWVFRGKKRFSAGWWGWAAYFVFLTASHGLLDAMTDGGEGVAFFAPFSATRYFFPPRYQRILVAPFYPGEYLTTYGWHVIRSELLWVWLPAGLVMVGILGVRGLAALWRHPPAMVGPGQTGD